MPKMSEVSKLPSSIAPDRNCLSNAGHYHLGYRRNNRLASVLEDAWHQAAGTVLLLGGSEGPGLPLLCRALVGLAQMVVRV